MLNIDLNRVLKDIKPTEEEIEKLKIFSSKLIHIINDYAAKKGINGEAVLVGSVAKDTWLEGEADIDIFIKFPLNTSKDDLKKYGLELGYKCIEIMQGKSELRYASHPYVTGFIEGHQIDFVPCYSIRNAEELKSAVDRTILHTEYVIKNLKEEQKGEVILLKKFMESIHTYGAEFKVSGFSGYLCELLIIHYGTFWKVLEAASEKWQPKIVIDIENHGTQEQFKDPMVVIDPTDKKRNVSAALNIQKISEFIAATRNFIGYPKEGYFYQRAIKVDKNNVRDDFSHRETKILLILFKPPSIPADALYPQIKKTENSVRGVLEREDFKVFNTASYTDEKENVVILVEFEVWKLPAIKKHYGPQIWYKDHQVRFLSKYMDKAAVEGDRWVAETERKYQDAQLFLEDILVQKRIGVLRFGKHVKKEILKKHQIMEITDYLDSPQINDKITLFLYEYLHKNIYYKPI